MPTLEHGMIAVNISAAIKAYIKQRGIGRVAVEASYRADEKNVFLPDVSYSHDTEKPVSTKGSVLYLPDLAVEIKSPDSSYEERREKAKVYLKNGTRLVWLVYPGKKLIEVYRPNQDSELLTIEDILEGGEVLEGFTLPIREVFDLG